LKKGAEMVTKRIFFILLALMLAVSISLIGCGGGEQEEEEEEEEEAPTAVLIGATLPQTGDFAGFGWQGWGMQAAVDDWNGTSEYRTGFDGWGTRPSIT
jgi:hypothetical protein